MGKLIRGITKELNAVFFAADSTDIVQEARELHQCSNTATAALGRLLTAGSLLGVGLKNSKEKLTLRVVGNGPIGYILVNSDRSGNVKGSIKNPQVELPLTNNAKLRVGEAVGEGSLYVIKDLGLKEPYIGISKLVSGEIGDDIASYLYQSEQVNSVVMLGVFVDNSKVLCSGGLLVQLLPGATEDFIEKLEKRLETFTSFTEKQQELGSLENVVEAFFQDVEAVEFTDEQVINYECDCSKERFYKKLITLGKDELKEMFSTQAKIEAVCQFCNTTYTYTIEDFSDVMKDFK